METFLFLVYRHIKLFFKSKGTFFFSLMVPLTTIIIYYIMLRQMELSIVYSQINEIIKEDPNHALDTLKYMTTGLVDSWMLSGIVGLSCITVSMNTVYLVFKDRENGVIKDFVSSPIKPVILSLSYFAFNYILTFMICFIVLSLSLIIVCSMGALIMTVTLFFQILAALLLSIFVASMFTMFITALMKKGDNYNFIISITSAGLGFFIGAFMPISMLGNVGYVCGFIPGTYSLGLFRYLYLFSQQDRLINFVTLNFSKEQATALMNKINENFSFNINFLNIKVDPVNFWWILAIGGAIFTFFYLFIKFLRRKSI